MKIVTDYMVGNTAVRFINTGRRVKIIDVERKKIRKSFLRHFVVSFFLAALLAISCLYVVRLENKQVMLDKEVYVLTNEVNQLEKEKLIIQKKQEEQPLNYETIYKKARALGMRFPTNAQISAYEVEKSTAIRNHIDE